MKPHFKIKNMRYKINDWLGLIEIYVEGYLEADFHVGDYIDKIRITIFKHPLSSKVSINITSGLVNTVYSRQRILSSVVYAVMYEDPDFQEMGIATITRRIIDRHLIELLKGMYREVVDVKFDFPILMIRKNHKTEGDSLVITVDEDLNITHVEVGM